jgi:orotidine-5'-phosphate decarboxylase
MSASDLARRALCVALDAPRGDLAAFARSLGSWVGTLKVGLWLFTARGPQVVRDLKSAGTDVILDLKLHDIPNTVEAAAREAASLGVSLLTVHASGGEAMIGAAVRGSAAGSRERAGDPTRVVAVTVLTSLGAPDLSSVGWSASPAEVVERLSTLARRAGAAGVVCSPAEAATIRKSWPEAYVVTPGIRPEGSERGDQARTATPAAAIRTGANLLVIGRPILDAKDPVAAARSIHAEVLPCV